MAVDPTQPAIPQPVADVGALAAVTLALKQRVENIVAYLQAAQTTTARTAASNTAASYILPVASTTVLGGVMVDGTTVNVVGGILSAASGAAPATLVPAMDGTASAGRLVTYARADHVHPTDTTLYPASNPLGFVTRDFVNISLPTLVQGLNFSALPTSDPGLGRMWLNNGVVSVGAPTDTADLLGLEDSVGDWATEDNTGVWTWLTPTPFVEWG